MEGERILKELKAEQLRLDQLVEDARNYVAPLFHADPAPCPKILSKLEVFSVKLLKLSLERAKSPSTGPAAPHLSALCQLAVSSLQVCAGSSGKVPALSFEKLLLHFAQLSLSRGDHSNGMAVCATLRGRLEGRGEGRKAADTLLRHAFDLAWKAALSAEQNGLNRSPTLSLSSTHCPSSLADECLDLRQEAFSCLLSASEVDAEFAVERVLKTSLRYQQLVGGRGRGGSRKCFERLHKFHSSLLAIRDLPSLLPASQAAGYLTALARVAHSAGEAQPYLERAERLTCDGPSCCDESTRGGRALVCLTSTLLLLDRPTTGREDVSTRLQAVSGEMEAVVGHCDSMELSLLHRLCETSEDLFAALEKRRAGQQGREGSASDTVLSREAFPSLKSLAACLVQLLEVRLARGGRGGLPEEQAARSAQLSVLNFVAQVLLSLLQDEYPEIEASRSSTASSPIPPSQFHQQTLAEACIPILVSTQEVIGRASAGSLGDGEHRWLGNCGYNLGLALFRVRLLGEASGVLRLACGELGVWCEAGQTVAERAGRWGEAQLVKKTSLLVDCLRDSCRYGDVMTTLVSTTRALPAPVMCEGVKVMVEMWVRGKMELATHQPDSEAALQWRDRTLLSLLSPPPSTRHQAHILTAEFTECARYGSQGLANQIAVGRELVEVYREGGPEWDGERGRVMVAMVPTDSSLLDEALSLLEGVVSCSHYTLTPSHTRHQALPHLATAHTLKAIADLQGRMGLCAVDVSSHDQRGGSHDVEACLLLSSEQCAVMVGSETERQLSSAVGRWCEWGGEEGDGGEEMGKVFRCLHLTAELCCVARKPQLACTTLGVLVKVYQRSPDPSLTASYQTALAAYCQLGVCRGPHSTQDFPWDTVEESLLAAVREEGGGRGTGAGELRASYLRCRLALAALHLYRGEIDSCRTELVGLFRDPVLSRHSLSAHTLTAGTRITAAHFLQSRHVPILPLKKILTRLLTDQSTPAQGPASLRVTAVELVASAVKTLTSLADHCRPGSEGGGRTEGEGREGEALSSDPVSWRVLADLLEGLLLLARLHLSQGGIREALYYCREGAALARRLALTAWYREFLLLLSEVHSTKGDNEAAQAALSTFSSLSTSSPGPPASPLHTARSEAESLLDLRQPARALTLCREAIEDDERRRASCGPVCDGSRDVGVAWLHLLAGRAVLQEVESSRPVLMEQLWGAQPHKTQRKAGPRRAARVLGWLSLVPEPFCQALSHLLTALQLAHPTCPSLLLRQVYQWLSVLLSPYHHRLASHCLLQSSHLSLAHHAATMLGKKIRKYGHRDSSHPFQDVLMTLQDSCGPCPDSGDPLVLARAVLQPPTFPPPLSHTLSLLASLPDGCQLTTACLAPPTTSQDQPEHLLLCAVGKNREPLFVKTLIEGQAVLGEFSATLAESDESMRLSEKRTWWTTRRRLDRRMKEVVEEMESQWLGDCQDIFGPSPPSPGSATKGTTTCHLLCLGRLVQHLPWEAMPVLRGQAVGRTPSLSFSVAHSMLQSAHSGFLDPDRGYYVLNPRGDLPATEKRFHGWFEEGLGWSGVVGHAPSTSQYSEALEQHDVFVYCGHGTGREFLSTDNFQLLCCQATTLLMGCSSGRLVVGGACDPAGMALSYLLSGCPSLVAVLWDVTDGDIDKLSKALLEQWLEGEGDSGGRGVSLALAAARSVCKLEGLNGFAAVVYGDPRTAVATSS